MDTEKITWQARNHVDNTPKGTKAFCAVSVIVILLAKLFLFMLATFQESGSSQIEVKTLISYGV